MTGVLIRKGKVGHRDPGRRALDGRGRDRGMPLYARNAKEGPPPPERPGVMEPSPPKQLQKDSNLPTLRFQTPASRIVRNLLFF